MATTKTSKSAAAGDPDSLNRQSAGIYVSGDDRFEVRQSDAAWYLIDRQQVNELGQELIHGPFASLKEARAALPGARDVKPLLRSTKRRSQPGRPTRNARPKPPPPPPPTWIDRLPAQEATEVRSLIRALEREGHEDAEKLVRRDRESAQPEVASRLIAARLRRLIDDVPEERRQEARDLLDRALDIVTREGSLAAPLPRWQLVASDGGRSPDQRPVRRIEIS